MDFKLNDLIIKMLNQTYSLTDDNDIHDNIKNILLTPYDVSEILVTIFHVDVDVVDILLFNWLHINGCTNIIGGWNKLKREPIYHSLFKSNYTMSYDTATNNTSVSALVLHHTIY